MTAEEIVKLCWGIDNKFCQALMVLKKEIIINLQVQKIWIRKHLDLPKEIETEIAELVEAFNFLWRESIEPKGSLNETLAPSGSI